MAEKLFLFEHFPAFWSTRGGVVNREYRISNIEQGISNVEGIK